MIDDEIFDLQSLKDYLVLTDSEYGLQDEHIEKAIKILTKRKIYSENYKIQCLI